MTCFNGEMYLKKALETILSQTYNNWELIFVDNNSNDNSKKIISDINDKRIKYYKLDTTVNLGTVRKFAYSKCNGEFITFLDVDDYWDQNKIIKQLEIFQSNKNIDIVYSNYWQFSNSQFNKVEKKLFSGFCQKEIIESYINGKPLTAWLTLMIRKECIDNLDYSFDENLHICSDFDLIIRLSKNCCFGFDEGFLSYYRLHDMNESKNSFKEISELIYIIEKFNKDEKLSKLFKINNFSDKILLKYLFFNKISDKNNSTEKIHFSNIIYKFLNVIIKFLPKFFLKIFK